MSTTTHPQLTEGELPELRWLCCQAIEGRRDAPQRPLPARRLRDPICLLEAAWALGCLATRDGLEAQRVRATLLNEIADLEEWVSESTNPEERAKLERGRRCRAIIERASEER